MFNKKKINILYKKVILCFRFYKVTMKYMFGMEKLKRKKIENLFFLNMQEGAHFKCTIYTLLS